MRKSKIQSYCTVFFLVFLFAFGKIEKKRMVIYLIGDSTVADYSLDCNYMTKKFPITGWGQVFQPFFLHDSLHNWKNVFAAYPNGDKDNTHFQPEGARAVAEIVIEELKKITLPHNE